MVRALEKAGWEIHEQVVIPTSISRVFVNIRASRKTEDEIAEILIIEVKCFSDIDRRMPDLYMAIGQYLSMPTIYGSG